MAQGCPKFFLPYYDFSTVFSLSNSTCLLHFPSQFPTTEKENSSSTRWKTLYVPLRWFVNLIEILSILCILFQLKRKLSHVGFAHNLVKLKLPQYWWNLLCTNIGKSITNSFVQFNGLYFHGQTLYCHNFLDRRGKAKRSISGEGSSFLRFRWHARDLLFLPRHCQWATFRPWLRKVCNSTQQLERGFCSSPTCQETSRTTTYIRFEQKQTKLLASTTLFGLVAWRLCRL